MLQSTLSGGNYQIYQKYLRPGNLTFKMENKWDSVIYLSNQIT